MKIIKAIEDHIALFNFTFSLVLAIATGLLWISTQHSVEEQRKASQGALLLQLNRDFYFDHRMYQVRKAIESKRPLLRNHKGQFVEQDIDDYIGILDMISGLMGHKVLDEDLIGENFDISVEEAYKNKEIQDYIAQEKIEFGEDVFGNFEDWGDRVSKE